MKKHAIIVAGGKGTRMQSEVPKQFLELNGKPIIVRTISKFLEIEDVSVILVLPKDHYTSWDAIASKYFKDVSIKLAIGGASRSESVKAGLNLIDDDGLVAIHDAVRPHIDIAIIQNSFDSALTYGSGVAVVPLKDSIREIRNNESRSRKRDDFVLVQTPQTFRVSEIKNAYNKSIEQSFTDDASVYENAGYKVRLVNGSYANVKITTPEDLK